MQQLELKQIQMQTNSSHNTDITGQHNNSVTAAGYSEFLKHSCNALVSDPFYRVKQNCFPCLSKSHKYATHLYNSNEFINILKKNSYKI